MIYPKKDKDEKLSAFLSRLFDWAVMSFEYHSDEDVYKVPEQWPTEKEISDQLENGMVKGDCDDFAFTCHYALKNNGIVSDLVLCWVTKDKKNDDYHMVCHVNGYIMDNRFSHIMLAYDLSNDGYAWDKIGSGDDWYEVKEKLSTWS